MSGVMLVRQRVADIDEWKKAFRDPELDAVRRDHGLVVTGTYIDDDAENTVIVVMDMETPYRARQFAASSELARARERAGAVGPPDGVWIGRHHV